jgi:hypothetical protein
MLFLKGDHVCKALAEKSIKFCPWPLVDAMAPSLGLISRMPHSLELCPRKSVLVILHEVPVEDFDSTGGDGRVFVELDLDGPAGQSRLLTIFQILKGVAKQLKQAVEIASTPSLNT